MGLPTTFKSNLAVCPSKHLKEAGFNTKTGLYSLSSCDSSVSSSLRPGDIRAGDIRAGDILAGDIRAGDIAGDMRIGDLLTERGETDLDIKNKLLFIMSHIENTVEQILSVLIITVILQFASACFRMTSNPLSLQEEYITIFHNIVFCLY